MQESLRRRFLAKIFGNGISGAFTLLQYSLLGRALGPALFGQLVFVQNHFELLYASLEMGASSGYLTLVSQDKRLYRPASALYVLFAVALLLLTLAYVLGVTAFGVSNAFWPDVPPTLMAWGVLLGLSVYLGRTAVTFADVAGISQRIEILRGARAVLAFGCLAALALAHRISLPSIIVVLVASQLAFVYYCLSHAHRVMGQGTPDFSPAVLRPTLGKFAAFCGPLVLYSLSGSFFLLVDRWFLQWVSGSVQQGYFGIAVQLSYAITLVTAALTPLVHRESAVAFSSGDFERIRQFSCLYRRRLMAVASIPSLFLALNAAEVTLIVGGKGFGEGALTVALMALYTIHQSSANLSGVVLLAMKRTRAYMIIGFARDLVGLVVLYLAVAPHSWPVPGLELGAPGLVVKMLAGQLVYATLLQLANDRALGIRSGPELGAEWLQLGTIAVAATAARAVTFLPGSGGTDSLQWGRLLTSATVYAGLIAAAIWAWPALFSLDRSRLRELVQAAIRRIGIPIRERA